MRYSIFSMKRDQKQRAAYSQTARGCSMGRLVARVYLPIAFLKCPATSFSAEQEKIPPASVLNQEYTFQQMTRATHTPRRETMARIDESYDQMGSELGNGTY